MTIQHKVSNRLILRGLLLLLILAVSSFAPEAQATEPEYLLNVAPPGRTGGRVVSALRAEPKTFNPVIASDLPSRTVLHRTMADLIHINRQTQRTEPALARSWTVSPDGLRYRLELRRGIHFSDGEPFDADDVVFTFQVYLDEKVTSPNRDLLIIGGEPIQVHKLDRHTVEVVLKEPYAVGERLFDSLAVLPEHRLGEAYREERFTDMWRLGSRVEEIVGLGPFRLRSYVPGQRLVLERNPHYWKVDRKGQRLPYLDELVFLFVPDQEAQTIRFAAAETDLIDHLSAAGFNRLAERPDKTYVLEDLGPGLVSHFLFFNLNDLGEDQPELRGKQAWFRQRAFRQAVSLAIDRQGIARLVYEGRATPVWSSAGPGNKLWVHDGLPRPDRSIDAARQKLRAAGFTWDDAGRLRDGSDRPVEFTLVTNSSNSQRVGMATIIQDDLAELGMRVSVAPLEFRTLVDRVLSSHDFEACILGMGGGDVDPNSEMNVWMSSGGGHFWHLDQSEPATPWEAELDQLMRQQLAELDPAARKRLFDRVQEIVAVEQPLIFLISPNVLVGARKELGNFRPAILEHPTLWNVDELFWRSADAPPGP